MHLQVRLNPKASPPDVEKVLGLVADANVNLVAVGGSDVEFGGELALVPEEDDTDQNLNALLSALSAYNPRVLRVDDPESGLALCLVDDTPGALHACLKGAATDNLDRGRIIRDILVGIPNAEQRSKGKIPVHIYSELVRTPQSLG